MLVFLSLIACQSGSTYDVTGTDGYSSFNPSTAFFGASFIVFTNKEQDCMDMAWVQRTNMDGEDPPYESNLQALQITFNESDVTEGSFSVGGEAPVKAEYLNISDGTFGVSKATEGTLEVDSIEDERFVTGAFNFAFSEGQISGTYDIEWCVNLKS